MNTKYHFSSLSEVKDVANQFIKDWGDHKIVAFFGEMGVGKTTLIKDICAALGVMDVVNSPSFSLVNEYLTTTNKTVYHFDFYRIESQEEAIDMGCNEYFYSGNYCFIEWPEKIESLLPPETLRLSISLLEGELREVLIE